MKKRVFSIALCLVVVLSLAIGVYAESTPQPRWSYISYMTAGINSGYIGGSVDLYNRDFRVNITVTLQHWNSGWSDTSSSWSGSGTGSATASNSSLSLGTGLWRAKVTAKVYNSGGVIIETATVYSDDCLIN